MKSGLSYKSKRNIIISVIIIALLAIIATSAYFFIKGNDDSSAAFTNNNMQASENSNNGQTEGQENNGQGTQTPARNPEENQGQNPNQTGAQVPEENNNGTTNPNTTTTPNTGITNNGTTGTTTTVTGEDVPNQEYVTERIEQQEVLVSEDYMVEWNRMSIDAETMKANIASKVSIIRPIITADKTADKEIVAIGEKLTYTITVTNSGTANGTAIIKDEIPEGTSFVEGSIVVNEESKADLTAENLAEGISVDVEQGKQAIVKFTVEVTEKIEGNVSNIAVVNDTEKDKPTNETKTAVITFDKVVDEKEVKVGDTLTYTITATNNGEKDGTVTIKDTAPNGTQFILDSLTINGEKANYENNEEALKSGIDIEVKAGKTVTVEFEVTVTEKVTGNVKNIAYINDQPTDGDETETKVKANIIFVTNGGTPVDEMKGYVGETIEDRNMPTTQKDGYVFKGWYAEPEFINEVNELAEKHVAGTTYYYAKWEARADLTGVVNYYLKDTTTKLAPSKELTGLIYNTELTEEAIDIIGYNKVEPTSETIIVELEGNEINFYYTPATNTPYTVEYYYQENGTYPETTDIKDTTRTGTTGEVATILEEDKTAQPEKIGYVFDAKANNVLSETIAADGSTILKVYFKQQFTVTYTDGVDGEEVFKDKTTSGIDYGTKTPEFGTNPTRPGYVFKGWSPKVVETVTENAIYVAQWEVKYQPYTIEYYYNGVKADKETINATAPEGSNIPYSKAPEQDGYTYMTYTGIDGKDKGSTTIIDGTNLVKVYYGKPVTTVVKTASKTVEAGKEIEYTITVKNTGYLPATVTVTDELIGTTYVEKSAKVGNKETEPAITENSKKNKVLSWEVKLGAASEENPEVTETITFKATTPKDSFGREIKNTVKIVNQLKEEDTSTAITTKVNEIGVKYSEWTEGQKGTDLNIIFVLDNSSSMNFPIEGKSYRNDKNPIAPTDVSKTRLYNAKKAIKDFIDDQSADTNTSMSVITFNSENTGIEKDYKTLIDEKDIVEKEEQKWIEGHYEGPFWNQVWVEGHYETVTKRLATINGVEYEVSNNKTTGSDGKKYYYVNETIPYGARLVGTNTASNEELKTKVDNISISSNKSGFGTYVSPAFKLINDNKETYLKDGKKNIVIVLADGKFNGRYNTELTKLKGNVDEIYCIGFGSGEDYNAEAMKEMSTNDTCYTATNSATLLDAFKQINEAAGSEQSATTENGKVTFDKASNTIKVSESCPIEATYDTGKVDEEGKAIMETLFKCTEVADLAKYGLTIIDGTTITWDAKKFLENNDNVIMPSTVTIKYYVPRTK